MPTPVETVHTLFGAFPGPDRVPNSNPVEYKADMRRRVCEKFGVSELPVERIFNEAGSFAPPPAATDGAFIISFALSPDRVLDGDYDQQIIDYVQALDPKVRYWLCLNHECDNADKGLDPEEQRDAFAWFSTIIHAHRVNNRTKVAPILMSWTVLHGDWRQWLPEPWYMDALGIDAYCRPGTGDGNAAALLNPLLAAAEEYDTRLLIPELGIGALQHGGMRKVGDGYVPITETERETFYREAVGILKDRARAVCQFEANKPDHGDWRIAPHEATRAIYAAEVQAS